jgi:hypothetical protein
MSIPTPRAITLESRGASIEITTDHYVGMGEIAIALEPPEAFNVTVIEERLRIDSAEGRTGGQITIHTNSERRVQDWRIISSDADIFMRGTARNSILGKHFCLATSGEGAIHAEHILANGGVIAFRHGSDPNKVSIGPAVQARYLFVNSAIVRPGS